MGSLANLKTVYTFKCIIYTSNYAKNINVASIRVRT